MLWFSQHSYNLEQYSFVPIDIPLAPTDFFDFSADFPPPWLHVPCVITETNGAKGLMAHIFDRSSDDQISGAIRIDTCAGTVGYSELGVAAIERPARGTST